MNTIKLYAVCIFAALTIWGCGSEGSIEIPKLDDTQKACIEELLSKEGALRRTPLNEKEKKLLTLLYLENFDVWKSRYGLNMFGSSNDRPIIGNGIPFP